MQLIFGSFLVQMSKFVFWVPGWVLAIKSKHFKYFLKISLYAEILSLKVVWQPVRELVHSLSGDNNLVLFRLWLRETAKT